MLLLGFEAYMIVRGSDVHASFYGGIIRDIYVFVQAVLAVYVWLVRSAALRSQQQFSLTASPSQTAPSGQAAGTMRH